MASPFGKTRDSAGTLLTSVAISRKSSFSSVDETSQLMMGLLLVVVVGAVIGLVCAMHYSSTLIKDDAEDAFLQDDNARGHLPVGERVDSRRGPESEHDLSTVRLNSSMVVPRAGIVYYLPAVSQQRKSLEAFSVLDANRKPVMGVLVKQGDDDPGILLHGSPSSGGAGAPLAFIGTHPEAIRSGQLRIAWPSAQHPRGEMFGTLEPDGDAFKVVHEGQLLLWIGGGSQNFVLSTGMRGSGKSLGTTKPSGDYCELHLQSGADAALTVLCVLAVMQLGAST